MNEEQDAALERARQRGIERRKSRAELRDRFAMTALDFGPEPHSPVTQWVKRLFQTLQEREHDPVEQAERAAVFET